MAASISAKLDSELEHALSAYAHENGLSRSQALREVLRQAISSAKPVSRGWREGFMAGKAAALGAMQDALERAAAEEP